MKLFKVSFGEAFQPFIFATSFDAAASVFDVWYQIHREGGTPNFSVFKVKMVKTEREHPHYVEAINRGVCGVVTYDPERGWSSTTSDEVMHLYEVVATDGSVLSVFGESYDQAAILYAAWHAANRQAPLPDFEVLQRNPKWPGLNTGHVLDALALEKRGVGLYDPQQGWTIVSPLGPEEN